MVNKIILFFLFYFLNTFYASASVCTALVSGDWEAVATWSCGNAPTCGDSLIIPVGITITVTQVDNYMGTCGSPPMKVVIYGTLSFVTGKKLELPCNSAVYIEPGGTIDPGGGGGSSNLISICGTNYWIAGEGPVTGPQCFNCVLPIRLITFNATCTGNDVLLKWETATETNNRYFSIMRSEDGYVWNLLAVIQGAGTSSFSHNYSWTDADPLPGNAYYRLEQTDFDGQTSYAGIIASSCKKTE